MKVTVLYHGGKKMTHEVRDGEANVRESEAAKNKKWIRA